MKGIDAKTPSTGGKRQDALFVSSLEKGLRVLYAFRRAGASLGLREIAEETGLHVSAAQRFTHTLHRLGYLAKDKRTKRYRLAPKLLDFSFTYLRADGLAECAAPHMIELAEQCDETINLSQLEGTDTICVSRMPRRGVRSPSGVVGARRPAFCTSSGRAMLACLPEHEAIRLVEESDRTALTPKTLTGRDEILDRLAHVRSTGYGIVEEEFVIGEISIAAPILDYSGRPAGAINIPVPSARWSSEAVCERLAPLVIQTARAISRTKGAAKAFD
jgi:DNA-binding IclR family transcriptional regulator